TAGRSARNLTGRVIMYADTITESMQKTIDSTNYRRSKQIAYNEEHGVSPQPIVKPTREIIGYEYRSKMQTAEEREEHPDIAADPVVQYMSAGALEKAIARTKRDMEAAAGELDFIEAARLRDEMYRLQEMLKQRT
ncbi:MAG: excinuclease ABC subunit B, partial [Mangrovibacterium sp.]